MIEIKGKAGCCQFLQQGHIVKSKLDKDTITLNFYHVTDDGELNVTRLDMTFDDAKKVAEAIWERLEQWNERRDGEVVDYEGNRIGPYDDDYPF